LAWIVEYKNITQKYNKLEVLKNLSLEIEEKDFTVIFGLPSCGKSVLMRLLMGLEKPVSGQIFLRGQDTAGINAGDRNIGYIPQSFALYPHLSVYDNIAYPLKLMKKSKAEIAKEVDRVSEMLNIKDLLQKKPDQTSGGQKQRIAIARGIIKDSDLFILDDPLVGLDFKLREQLVYDLKELQDVMNATFIYTTSDTLEALELAKTLVVLNEGKVVEKGSPFELYTTPKHTDTMSILGFPNANMLAGTLSDAKGSKRLTTDLFKTDIPVDTGYTGNVMVGIRPEDFSLSKPDSDFIELSAVITLREDLGGEEILYFEVGGVILTMMVWHHEEKSALTIGSNISVYLAKDKLVCFDEGNKLNLKEGE